MFFNCLPCCAAAECTCTTGACHSFIYLQITSVSLIDNPFTGPYNEPPTMLSPIPMFRRTLVCDEINGCEYNLSAPVYDGSQVAGRYRILFNYTPQSYLDSRPALPQFTGYTDVQWDNANPPSSNGPYDFIAGGQYFDFDICSLGSTPIGVSVELGTNSGVLQMSISTPFGTNPLP